MQEAIIDPKTVDTFVQTIFGSYEKFILSLIKRRQVLAEEKRQLTQKLAKITKEENLIKDILTGYHGKKIDGQYYDSTTNSFSETKPKSLPAQSPKPSILDSLSQYYEMNKGQYGELVEAELKKNSQAETKTQVVDKLTLQNKADKVYEQHVVQLIKKDYLPESNDKDIIASIDKHSMQQAFDNGFSPKQFAMKFARKNNLQKTSPTNSIKLG